MTKLNWMTKACGAFLLWAMAAIPLTAQTFTTLLNFNGTDGASPYGTLVQGTNGAFYGTTNGGGAYTNIDCLNAPCGTVFEITPSGVLTTLYNFCSKTNCADGWAPTAGLVQGTNGSFYGTTAAGGIAYCQPLSDEGCGTVFKITPGGALTTLHKFDATDGLNPEAALIQDANGDFYGTVSQGGSDGDGTVFEITPGGTLTTLHNFDSTDGTLPYASLVQAANGNLYGTTEEGGTSGACGFGCGTIFTITPSGILTTLHSFDGTDGRLPAGLVQGTDGKFYGVTIEGGASSACFAGCGTAFTITPSGVLTTLHSFVGYPTDGDGPKAALVEGSDGNFYGTTQYGGANNSCNPNGCGTVFMITPSGTLTTLHSFDGTDGLDPYTAGLVQGTDGTFYGTAGGGSNGDGTVFSLAVGLKPFVETQPSSGIVGTAVRILGTNLTGATSVTFNGTSATFTVASGSEITTTVPAGATSGTVQVKVSTRTLSSNVPFRVK